MGDRYVGHSGWSSNSKAISTQGGQQQDVLQWTSRVKHEDKATGSYERYTEKEKVSSGQQFVERSTGRVGYKDEAQRSSTVKFGDKSGYTEVHTEQKVKTVTYDNSPGYNSEYIDNGHAYSGYKYNNGYNDSHNLNSGYIDNGQANSGYANNGYYESDNADIGYNDSGHVDSGYVNSGYYYSGYDDSDSDYYY